MQPAIPTSDSDKKNKLQLTTAKIFYQ